jgi:hypothetical protein
MICEEACMCGCNAVLLTRARLYVGNISCMLSACRGLGKTMQCSAFISGLIHGEHIGRAIIVAPKTLLAHWAKELELCGLGGCTHHFDGTATTRYKMLAINVLDQICRGWPAQIFTCLPARKA